MEEYEFIIYNQIHIILVFLGLWFSYCWWLAEQYRFNFGRYTTILRLLFCIIHVLAVWTFFQYIIKFAVRLYHFSRRLRAVVTDHLIMIALSFVLFLLLTFVLNFKDFLTDAFAIVD
ncbi:unnamed protein product [Adineta steineri]|uniref:Uncharacterized protein n=1 Tax=Adineta steineri TaxID=433720 RepID=A0A814UFM0_9BILA|nr:unnamed protein product [Adineta steineri]CAF1291207.1 unnamed protein product [Adineta steineri]